MERLSCELSEAGQLQKIDGHGLDKDTVGVWGGTILHCWDCPKNYRMLSFPLLCPVVKRQFCSHGDKQKCTYIFPAIPRGKKLPPWEPSGLTLKNAS